MAFGKGPIVFLILCILIQVLGKTEEGEKRNKSNPYCREYVPLKARKFHRKFIRQFKKLLLTTMSFHFDPNYVLRSSKIG